MLFRENGTLFAAKATRSDISPTTLDVPNRFHSNPLWKPADETIVCDFSQDGKIFAWSLGQGFVGVLISEDEDLVAFRDETGVVRQCSRVIDCAENVTSILFLPKIANTLQQNTCALLATGLQRGPIKVWNAITGEVVHVLFDHTARITSLTFAPFGDPLLMSSSVDKTLKIWDLSDNGNMCLTMRHHKQAVNSCACSPANPKLIASVGNCREVFLWTLADKRQLRGRPAQLRGHENDVMSCSWSPDGAIIATASCDSTVIMWDAINKNKILTLGHQYPMPSIIYRGGANGSWVSCVAFSKDGRKLATTCEDNKLRVWHVYDDNEVRVDQVQLDKSALRCVFAPNGNLIAVGQNDGSVKVVDINDITTHIPSLSHLSRLAARKELNGDDLITCSRYLPYLLNAYLTYRS